MIFSGFSIHLVVTDKKSMGIYRLDSMIDLTETEQHQNRIAAPEMEYPYLKCQVSLYSDAIILSQKEYSYRLPCPPQSIAKLQNLLSSLNGSNPLQELQRQFSPNHPEQINQLIQQLATRGLVENRNSNQSDSKQHSILKWEELFSNHLSKKLQQQSLQYSAATPPNITYGFALEYYHLIARSFCFYTPLLPFQDSAKIRNYLNQFYCQINLQNQLLLQGFLKLGNSQEDLENLMPLPETMALCNAFIYWAYSDPVFCISLLAIWEVQVIKTWENYLSQFNPEPINDSFLATVQQFILLKSQAQPESLRDLIIAELSPFDHSVLEGFQRQIHLFIELTQNFYAAIEDYYSINHYYTRQISAI